MPTNVLIPRKQEKVLIKRRKLLLKCFWIGIVSGLMAISFRLSLEAAEKWRNSFLLSISSMDPPFLVIPSILCGLTTILVIYVTLKIEPDSSGSGIPHLKGYLEGFNRFRAWRILLVKFIGGIVGIGSCLALGREGPTVQMGAAIGKISGDYVSSNQTEHKILVSAGAGAGLSAAFNAPLAGVFFVLEELYKDFNQATLVAAFVSCITADIVCHVMIGTTPVLKVDLHTAPEINLLPLLLVFGIFIGFLGLLFNKLLLASSMHTQHFSLSKKILLGGLVGIVLGGTGLIFPECLGTGAELTMNILNHTMGIDKLALFFFLRFVFTIFSYNTGAPGGIFTPMLLLGVLSGTFFGYLTQLVYPNLTDLSVWGILGMAGYFSAVVRAPITGTILILEMTSSYELLLPLMIVSIVSYSIPEFFSNKPIYEALLQKDLSKRTRPQ
ncbi:MAG: H(+)/Cl(-) exchange transporter ClcA [Magnetococcales bacterium]|nr:H(+)/Cl(-) exchange transporter ClcA [Magnetococcales bacterium]